MYCMTCGTQLPDDAQFCYSCGEKQSSPQQKSDLRTQRIPAYDFIVCANCGKENSAPNTTCDSCSAELSWEQEQKKYNKGLVNVLAYMRPFGKRFVLYNIWILCEHPAGNDELRTSCAMYQGRPFYKPYLTEQLDVIEQPKKSVERTFFAFSDFTPGYLLGVFPSVKQVYWFQATPKEIVGGLEEESDFLSPLLLVDLVLQSQLE